MANGLNVTAQRRGDLNWDKVLNNSQHDLTMEFFEDSGCRFGWGLKPRPPARQTSALPTGVTGQLFHQELFTGY